MSEERKKLGYGIDHFPSFVIKKEQFDKERDNVQIIINEADVVILGSAPDYLLRYRHKKGLLVYINTERLYKTPLPKWKAFPMLIKNYLRFGRHKNDYILCSSAFTAYDFSLTGNFANKTYKWGYFPETIKYNVAQIINDKKPFSILWAGRFIQWKHPEIPILIAERLKNNGFSFEMNIIGTGELGEYLSEYIIKKDLADNVHLLGAMSPENVRKHMEKSEIYLSTSDRNEGWGVVINEAMNSACAVVASSEIGSVPFLIEDKVNGLIFDDGNIDAAYNLVLNLLTNHEYRRKIGTNAYYSIVDKWNAKIAAERFVKLSDEIIATGGSRFFIDGPCSRAEIIEDYWYKKIS